MPPETKLLDPMYTQGNSIVLCRGNSWAELSPNPAHVLSLEPIFLYLGCQLLRSCAWIFEIVRSRGGQFHGRWLTDGCWKRLGQLHCMTYKVLEVSANLKNPLLAETWASSLLFAIRCVGQLFEWYTVKTVIYIASNDCNNCNTKLHLQNFIWHHMMKIFYAHNGGDKTNFRRVYSSPGPAIRLVKRSAAA